MSAAPIAAPSGPLDARSVRLAFTGLLTAMALAAIDSTTITTALPTIVGELGGIRHYAWVGTAFMLANTIAMPLFGKFSDLHGRRTPLLIAISVYALGTIACGVSTSMTMLITARGLQGLGSGGIMAMNFAIIADLVPGRSRARYISYVTGLFAAGGVVGPLLGGFMVDHLNWRWIFFVSPPLSIVSLAVCWKTLRYRFEKREAAVDLIGAILLVLGVGAVIVLVSLGGRQFAWGSGPSVALGAGAVAALVGFVWQEHRAPEPILPMRLFRSRVFSMIVVASLLIGTMQMASTAFLPLFLQAVKGVSATNSGLLLLPQIVALFFSTVLLGRVMARTGRYKRYIGAGIVLVIAAVALLTRLHPGTSRTQVTVAMAMLGFGFGATPTLTIALQAAVGPRDHGVASSASHFFRALGGSIGLAVYGAALTARLDDELTRRLPGGDVTASIIQTPKAVQALPERTLDAVTASLSEAISFSYLLGLPALVVAALVIWSMREIPLDEPAEIPVSVDVAPAAS